jgi:hypothetical protein
MHRHCRLQRLRSRTAAADGTMPGPMPCLRIEMSYNNNNSNAAAPTTAPKTSFAWTILRDPTTRVTSQFFHFEVSRRGTLSSDQSFREYLHDEYETRDALDQYYLRLLSPVQRQPRRLNDTAAVALIQQILLGNW